MEGGNKPTDDGSDTISGTVAGLRSLFGTAPGKFAGKSKVCFVKNYLRYT